MAGLPTVDEVRRWVQAPKTAIDDDQLQRVVNGELIQQARSCRVPADPDDYPDDLTEALYRRVGRVLAGRQVPLGLIGDPASEYGASNLVAWDAEVERIEGSRRMVVFG